MWNFLPLFYSLECCSSKFNTLWWQKKRRELEWIMLLGYLLLASQKFPKVRPTNGWHAEKLYILSQEKSLNPMHGKCPFSGGDLFKPWDFSATSGQRHEILNFGGDFGHFPALWKEKFFEKKIPPGKWPFSRPGIFRGGKWLFSGWNSTWKMASF